MNKPIRDITKVELVYSSLSNTILTFSEDDYFYFQEEGDPYFPSSNNTLYIEESSLLLPSHYIHYTEYTSDINAKDKVLKWYETDEYFINNYSITITPNEYNSNIVLLCQVIQSRMNLTSPTHDFRCSYDDITDQITISNPMISFGLDFSDDTELHLKLGFVKYKYDLNFHFTSTEEIVILPNSDNISERNVNIVSGTYTFESYINTLEQKMNNIEGSTFKYAVSLFHGCLYIEVAQDMSNIQKSFKIITPESYMGFGELDTIIDSKHIATIPLVGIIRTISLIDQPSYYPKTLAFSLETSLKNLLSHDNYKVEIVESSKIKITNNKTTFRIKKLNSDYVLFNFQNNEYSNVQLSNSNESLFGSAIIRIRFDNGSFTSDEILTFLKTRLNVFGRTGYDVTISLSTFKITISNNLKKFMIYFFFPKSVWRRFGFKQQNTEYKNSHTSDYTASFESSDYLLVQIHKIPTPITNKNTSACFFIPIVSTRYEVQTINENQSFNQSIKVCNLDLSDIRITLLDDEGEIIKSSELNFKMLIKCYK